MRILITGGAGFIGSHVVREMISTGNDVVVLDNLSTGQYEHIPNDVTFWQEDIRSAAVRERIASGHFDAVVHLAAQIFVDASIRDPYFDADENIMGLVNVLEGARAGGVRRVIFPSSAAVYGDVAESQLPLPEDTPLAPLSFYGLTKEMSERYLELYHRHYGLEYVVLRFANVYGERQGDKGEGGVISIFAKKAARGEDITIYGDGNQTRDFVYAGDIARGISRALVTRQANTAYNLCTQTETSLNDLVELFSRVRPLGQVSYGPAREGDIYRSCLSRRKAQEGLGWEPVVSLAAGLERTMHYFSAGSTAAGCTQR